MAEHDLTRLRVLVEGIVQGVGFRPFVYQLARRLELAGSVCNDTAGVTIEIEGPAAQTDLFLQRLQTEPPPLARITAFSHQPLPPTGETGFAIRHSRAADSVRIQVAPDTFVCADCRRELFDPADRRFRYPFINCTNCGPRYTIVTGIPYDRPVTTMAGFVMCAACQGEYDDPASRRFHAQPNACPTCGPRLSLLDEQGTPLSVDDPLAAAVAALRQGRILAVKGLGGYHLAVDAANAAAVAELRRRKRRDEKPFALMAAELTAVRRLVVCSDLEARLLEGPERPIVLLAKRPDHGLAAQVAPHNRYFGIMLPYTPLHYLLLERHFPALVMTSANLSDEPIAYRDEEVRDRLAGIADLFLGHDRPIETRTDDSIARTIAGRPLLLRRSRGYVPGTLRLPRSQPAVLAVGAELKSVFCLTRGDQAFLSQHIGDLQNLEVYDSLVAAIAHLRRILEIEPELIAHDLHPDYLSTRFAREQSDLPVIGVQHHHAHLAGCLAEHRVEEPAIGVIFDGLGYGSDGGLWGGEFLVGDLQRFERVGHFRTVPLPGGDLAARQPWRMALSHLLDACDGELPPLACFDAVAAEELALVRQAIGRRLNAPPVSSCGRLFDAVAALLGLRSYCSFEGQAAMELEMRAETGALPPYPYELSLQDGLLVFDSRPLIRALVDAVLGGEAVSRSAGRFHQTLADLIATTCENLRERTGLNRVVLTGGVFQNVLLTELADLRLTRAGFQVLSHSLVPPNDGGIALGQAVVAARQPLG
ncbi:MAG: carbamoyltransferase HypF [Desulfuromonadales bacterium]|nr:carbamoyltransferase HypF [Desulfuromonadales bacterium]